MTGFFTILLTPSSYPTDWYGWAVNQMGHMVVGMLLAIMVAWVTGVAFRGVIAAVVLTTGWEVFDYLTRADAQILDKTTDALFMAVGASLGYALWERNRRALAISVVMICLALAFGVWDRIA